MYMFAGQKLIPNILRFLGLWPYKRTKFERFRATCFYMLLISHVIAQLAQIAIADFNLNNITKILSDALPALIFVIKFNMLFFDIKDIKEMLEEINNYQRMLTDPQEIKIVEDYSNRGKNVIVMTLSVLTIALSMLVILLLIPDILNFLRPLNESRAHYLISLNEYYMNEGIQFYYLSLYHVISVNVGTYSVLSIGLMLVLVALHCCALFKICSYRIQHSVDKKVIACDNKRDIIVERIIKTVELHKNAQKLFKLFTSSYSIYFLIVLVVGMCSFIMNLYRFLYAITSMDFLDSLVAVAYIVAHELYLFGASLMGQEIVNHADELFNAIYISLWYKTPVTVQKSYLLIMQVCSKSVVLNIGGIYTSVMENFTSVMNTAISFMMVIYSVQ